MVKKIVRFVIPYQHSQISLKTTYRLIPDHSIEKEILHYKLVFIFVKFVVTFCMRQEMENKHTRSNWTLQRLMWNYGTYGKTMPLKYQIISQLGSNSIDTERKHSNSMLFQHVIFLSVFNSLCHLRGSLSFFYFIFGFCCSSVSDWLNLYRHTHTLDLLLTPSILSEHSKRVYQRFCNGH